MGIFDTGADIFTRYHARLQFRDRIMGATPTQPRAIEGWLAKKAGISDAEELRHAVIRTLRELGADVDEGASYEDIQRAATQIASDQKTVGFKRNADGLYLEGRIVKAMLKEVTNIKYAGDRWGVTKKGPRSYVAERVFVEPDQIPLGVAEPSGIELFIGHTSGPRGPQSNLTYYEYVTRPAIEFDVLVLDDCVQADHWAELWRVAQRNGLGALRSQGFGTFDIEAWDTGAKQRGLRVAS